MNQKITKGITILVMVFLLPSFVHAAPSVSGVSGTLSHNANVTVSGGGFGTKSPVAPLFWDPVDGMYSGITNGGVVPVGAGRPWNAASGGVDVYFKTTNPRGKFIAKYSNQWSKNSAKKGALGNRNFPGTKVLYVSWWMWLDKSACTPSTSNKYTRFTDDGGWSSNVQTVIWAPALIGLYGVGSGVNYSDWTQTCGKIGVWQRMESVVDNTTSPVKPSVYMAVDNAPKGPQPIKPPKTLLKDITGIGNLGFDGSNTAAKDQPTIDWGEIYADNTRARVEICNASTKSASNHCEIQIPHTTWVNNQIKIKVVQGSFANNSRAYLYVVDASGTVSNGLPITFGTSGASNPYPTPPPVPDPTPGEDTTPPAVPTGLRVQ